VATKKPSTAVRQYLESATPEQQRQFSKALLSRQSRVDGSASAIPGSVILASRVASLVAISTYALSVGWSEDLLTAGAAFVILGAVAWFPNELAAATGRLGAGPAVSRPSHPWVLLVIVWIFLLMMALAGALELIEAA